MKEGILIPVIGFCLPFLVYFCVKFGTVAYYKAKEFIEEEKRKEKEQQ